MNDNETQSTGACIVLPIVIGIVIIVGIIYTSGKV